ncbi:type 1 fimbrial protein [Pseudomonas sp. NFX15]|uniref:type 1 fimbrial protein n=1 Tax=Pseudomonas sp. NFX15 TaxID=2816958 RepID=UPI003B8D20C7
MDCKHVATGFGLIFALNGVCLATGSIAFEGRIVEPGCQSGMGSDARLALYACPAHSRGMGVEVKAVMATTGGRAVNVKLLADSDREGRYFDRQFVLVDEAGVPIRAGHYRVTLSMP